MVLFGCVRTTIVCPKVCKALGLVQIDDSPLGDMFRIMLKESGLTWNLKDIPEKTYDLEGSWEAMLKAYIIFTAIQVSEMEVFNEIALLLKWCKECVANVTVMPVNETAGQTLTLEYLLKTHSLTRKDKNPKAGINKRSCLTENPTEEASSHIGHHAPTTDHNPQCFGKLPKVEPNEENEMMDCGNEIEIDKTSEPDEFFNGLPETNVNRDNEEIHNEIHNNSYSYDHTSEPNEQNNMRKKLVTKSHNGGKEHVCTLCYKTFTLGGSLRTHMRMVNVILLIPVGSFFLVGFPCY